MCSNFEGTRKPVASGLVVAECGVIYCIDVVQAENTISLTLKKLQEGNGIIS
jgi:hypothetical protein